MRGNEVAQESWIDAGGMAYNLRYVQRIGTVEVGPGANLKLWLEGDSIAGRVIYVGSQALIEWMYGDLIGWMNSSEDERDGMTYVLAETESRYKAAFNSGSRKKRAS